MRPDMLNLMNVSRSSTLNEIITEAQHVEEILYLRNKEFRLRQNTRNKPSINGHNPTSLMSIPTRAWASNSSKNTSPTSTTQANPTCCRCCETDHYAPNCPLNDSRRTFDSFDNNTKPLPPRNKHFLQKKYNDAIHCYNQALKQNGEKAIYYVNRALCYIKLKQWDKVYQDARHCLDLDPNYIKAHAYLGQYYIEQQRYDEAITYFKQALELCKIQNKNFGDEIQRLLRYAQKRRFSIMEHKRIENEISLQTYLRSLIQTDKERRMQLRIEKYLEDKDPTQSSTNTLSILKQFLSKITNRHNQQITTNLASVVSVSPKVATTTTHNNEMNVAIDQQLEQALQDIEQSADQSINEMNTLFNEVDVRRKRREIPEYLTCKLCYDLMRDPVITPFGITYCRSCIEENLYKVSHLDPIANKPLVVDQLVNNLVLKEIVEKFIKENEWVNSECF
ncbi:unnamed protein product [Rotaria magnacalcarata]|uniref:RING-type E3 ubiquitin transferase n=1 Tax=Rotaria magnacalcarata TaxID=392030 RepID=A0A816LRX4_9BILA|nr:unnamed protein product [Rotaria magnacalcarata]